VKESEGRVSKYDGCFAQQGKERPSVSIAGKEGNFAKRAKFRRERNGIWHEGGKEDLPYLAATK